MPIISMYNCDNQKIVLKENKRVVESGMCDCQGLEDGETGDAIQWI